MKTLVISDIHLSRWYDEKKYNFLSNLIRKADQVIINGDFWDYWYINFDNFLNSPWNKLFPLLLEKNAIYIHGNHDPITLCNEKVALFSKINCESHTLNIDGKEFLFMHGHQLLRGNKSIKLEVYDRFIGFLEKLRIGKPLFYAMHYTEILAFKLFGPQIITKSKIALENNNIIKLSTQIDSNKWVICGHTHGPELDNESNFANSGCIINRNATYLFIENGVVDIVNEKY